MEERKTIGSTPFDRPVDIKLNGETKAKLTFEQLYFPRPDEIIDDAGDFPCWPISEEETRKRVDRYVTGLHKNHPTWQPSKLARKAAEAFKLKPLKPTNA